MDEFWDVGVRLYAAFIRSFVSFVVSPSAALKYRSLLISAEERKLAGWEVAAFGLAAGDEDTLDD